MGGVKKCTGKTRLSLYQLSLIHILGMLKAISQSSSLWGKPLYINRMHVFKNFYRSFGNLTNIILFFWNSRRCSLEKFTENLLFIRQFHRYSIVFLRILQKTFVPFAISQKSYGSSGNLAAILLSLQQYQIKNNNRTKNLLLNRVPLREHKLIISILIGRPILDDINWAVNWYWQKTNKELIHGLGLAPLTAL